MVISKLTEGSYQKLMKAAAVIVSITTVFLTGSLLGDEVHNHPDSSVVVGRVTFPISCSKEAQEDVEHGMAMMHSFLFDDAEDEFKAAAEVDHTCAMVYWAQGLVSTARWYIGRPMPTRSEAGT